MGLQGGSGLFETPLRAGAVVAACTAGPIVGFLGVVHVLAVATVGALAVLAQASRDTRSAPVSAGGPPTL